MITGISDHFSTIEELKNFFQDEVTCITHLEAIRWNSDIVSPFDNASKIYSCKGGRYRCRNTGKYFNVKTNTVFHNTKVDLQKWFVAIWIMTNNDRVTSIELSKQLDVTHKTAWLMQKRVAKYISQKAVPKTAVAQPKQMQLTDWLAQLK
ncbi:MAG: hypothetical protein EOO50_02775 [Flavobacterium sp.]|uniref:hypothetical protein n=1 Tax=Flavobacterium sp. TaxID=239 RepID=UPI0011F66464|nr:hypothetical protein [Flavobacterium sp.]RZJ68027.1 MAG: hypothetical protein EOO50_02775 [Flavobacterium sp.]